MEAKIIGIKNLDFDTNDGKIQMAQYFLNYKDEMETGLEGLMSGKANWNILERGKPPGYKLGDTINVQYNKNGRLTIL